MPDQRAPVIGAENLAAALCFVTTPKPPRTSCACETSPPGHAPSIFVHSPHALMLQGVRAMLTHSLPRALHSVGGVQVLFPLFSQLDHQGRPGDSQPDTSVCATLLSFVVDLLRSSLAMQEQMLATKGFLVIGYLLEKSSRAHLTRGVLEHFLSVAKYLDGLPHGGPLLRQLCDHILFNPNIWIHAPAQRLGSPSLITIATREYDSRRAGFSKS
ncbi:hypothetical protein CRUP_014311 [Coryphaenoides rupestris]|nr:hypothetical protein CRUP_014311 [Coryphaenoides rupestris]